MKKLIRLSSILTVIVFMQCQKESNLAYKTIHPTNHGVPGRLYCKVNDRAWNSCVPVISILTETDGEWIKNSHLELQFCDFCHDTNSGVYVYLHSSIDTGFYEIGNLNFAHYHKQPHLTQIFITNSTYTGQIHLNKFDKYGHKLSGSLEFSAIDTMTGETVRITEGIFNDLSFTAP